VIITTRRQRPLGAAAATIIAAAALSGCGQLVHRQPPSDADMLNTSPTMSK